MPDLRTTVTELVTGLGMLGLPTVDRALVERPPEMVSVSPETWELLGRAREGGGLAAEFDNAWSNGTAFLESTDGLRGRRPAIVEWKGSHRAPGDEVAPVDLRIDHVFFVSCKYLSKIVINASPFHLFDRLLQGGHGGRDADWYGHVAAERYQALYESVRQALDLGPLPDLVGDLRTPERRQLSAALAGGWPADLGEVHREFVAAVSSETARLWEERTHVRSARESLFWRILRMGSAPYFILGSSAQGSLRLRVATPWDWRQHFRLRRFEVTAQPGGQPRVGWRALAEDRSSLEVHEVRGHVEVRWSHGRFSGNPEAKVYLDTPHAAVPGYFELV